MLLDGGKALSLTQKDGATVVAVPNSAPDAIATVVVLDVKPE